MFGRGAWLVVEFTIEYLADQVLRESKQVFISRLL
jgi:hypothetical protein